MNKKRFACLGIAVALLIVLCLVFWPALYLHLPFPEQELSCSVLSVEKECENTEEYFKNDNNKELFDVSDKNFSAIINNPSDYTVLKLSVRISNTNSNPINLIKFNSISNVKIKSEAVEFCQEKSGYINDDFKFALKLEKGETTDYGIIIIIKSSDYLKLQNAADKLSADILVTGRNANSVFNAS